MRLKARLSLGIFLSLICSVLALSPALAAPGTVLKIGDQKGAERALMTAAGVLDHVPYRIEWDVFASAQALLEALNAGAIDTGGVGDGPFLFAYAARSPIKVVAVYHSDVGESVAIVVPKNSTIRSAADLKGHTIGTTRGSIGHFLLLKALAQAKLTPRDVTVAFLDPGSAKAAMESGSIDAWSTWDPYVALAQVQDRARVAVSSKNLLPGYGYQAASNGAIAGKRAVLDDFLNRLAKARRWAMAHKEAYAAVWAKETGLPQSVAQLALGRQNYAPVPIDDRVVSALGQAAGVYRAAGVIADVPGIPAAFDKSFNDAYVP
ncbi:MAG: ABC transporter substrate-binding protein [Rhizomicrobium sp.]